MAAGQSTTITVFSNLTTELILTDCIWRIKENKPKHVKRLFCAGITRPLTPRCRSRGSPTRWKIPHIWSMSLTLQNCDDMFVFFAELWGHVRVCVCVDMFVLQNCEDMFVLSKWNQSKTYSFEIKRDFGTDYGICCWYTPQLNFTEIDRYLNVTDVMPVSITKICTDTREKTTCMSRTGVSGLWMFQR